ncbi:MAG TPA: ABC transporter ATP-binding protein [Candidatus Bathyarchaeia archaeon]|nr:ABC transporter ATP-binding protein [Candidatus Bathyarchaeia archaeon]
MTATNEYAIVTSNLTKTYTSKIRRPEQRTSFFSRRSNRTVTAVNHLNLEIRRGELFGLLGRNGAGKTTLVKILCTLLPPDEGTASVNGFDVAKQQMKVKQSIGTIFSVGERGFFWRLTGYSNLEFYAAINNVPRHGRQKRIMEVLDLVGMKENAFEVFQKYSGGMKRKLALARALLPDPPILLLDEPTTGLDVVSSRNIREFIRNDLSRKAGKTVLYTTHYIEEASQICDRVAIMNKGQLIALDTPDALRSRVKKGEVVDVVVKNMTDAQINTLRGVDDVVSLAAEIQDAVSGKTRLRMRLENVDSLPRLFDFFFKEKIKIINFKQEEPTLEDAFIGLTGAGISE